jgi:hypothetical protein
MVFPVRGEEPSRALPEGSNSRCGVPGVALNAPKADADPRSDAGEGDEAMTIKQYEPIYELNPSN